MVAGETVFHIAAKKESLKTLVHLMKNLSNEECTEIINQKAENGMSAFHYAAYFGHEQVFKTYLPLSNIKNLTDLGNNVLHVAAQQGHTEICRIILEHANKEGHLSSFIDDKGRNGLTPLHHAAYHGHDETVITLLGYNANIFARTDSLNTPLHLAADTLDWSVINILLDKGAEDSIFAVNADGLLPLHCARGDYKLTVNMLKRLSPEKGAELLRAEDKDGLTALNYVYLKKGKKVEEVEALFSIPNYLQIIDVMHVFKHAVKNDDDYLAELLLKKVEQQQRRMMLSNDSYASFKRAIHRESGDTVKVLWYNADKDLKMQMQKIIVNESPRRNLDVINLILKTEIK